ncbi:MAG TPA: DinB family protein, partial [Polyangiales bacterium]
MLERPWAKLMAEYNAWMNEKIYQACAPLSDQERKQDRGAFFKSIHGTLNHLLWADRAFLIRLLAWDLPIGKPSDVLYEDFVALTHERKRYDEIILDYANSFP